MLRVGLTGGIACGKSHVLRRLAAAGLPALDLDQVARDVLVPGQPGHARVREAFGPSVLASDGGIDRKALGRIVFADDRARHRLNALVHPLIRQAESALADRLASEGASLLVTDGALLVESGVHLRFDRLVVVHCDEAQQLGRLMRRDGIDAAAARARVLAQMPSGEKLRFAHFAIDTSGRPEDTDRLADRLAEELKAAAARPWPVPEGGLERAAAALAGAPELGPRGLHPRRLLQALASQGAVEMETLRLLLEPAKPRPWYAHDGFEVSLPEAAGLASALFAWCLLRRHADPDPAVALAASVARLVGAAPQAAATVCLAVLALLRASAPPGGKPEDPSGLATRWGGARPEPEVLRLLAPALHAVADCRPGAIVPDELHRIAGAQPE